MSIGTSDQTTRDATNGAIPAVNAEPQAERQYRARASDYAVILKPRVMSLVVFTGFVGLMLAPGTIAFDTALTAILCIALGAGASGAINMWYDRDIDLTMARTKNRPIPAGRMPAGQALAIGSILSVGSVAVLAAKVNLITAGLLAFTILYYVFIYTIWLKRRTPQNIVIGGVAGALPPMIGWAAVTGDVSLASFSLFLIIMLWTPPHSWALALFSRADYERAGIPMLPVVAGIDATKRQILIYTLLMLPVTLLPTVLGVSGLVYGAAATVLGGIFLWFTLRLKRDESNETARPLFAFSIFYLFMIFVFLLVDRAVLSLL
jgi:protoheme IX farnesyltransferase